jgi:hypothetical protein
MYHHNYYGTSAYHCVSILCNCSKHEMTLSFDIFPTYTGPSVLVVCTLALCMASHGHNMIIKVITLYYTGVGCR